MPVPGPSRQPTRTRNGAGFLIARLRPSSRPQLPSLPAPRSFNGGPPAIVSEYQQTSTALERPRGTVFNPACLEKAVSGPARVPYPPQVHGCVRQARTESDHTRSRFRNELRSFERVVLATSKERHPPTRVLSPRRMPVQSELPNCYPGRAGSRAQIERGTHSTKSTSGPCCMTARVVSNDQRSELTTTREVPLTLRSLSHYES